MSSRLIRHKPEINLVNWYEGQSKMQRNLYTKAGEVKLKVPTEHWQRIRTHNPLERIMKEIRRRTRVVGAFPDGNSALMLVAAR